jgi:hypothetical protein
MESGVQKKLIIRFIISMVVAFIFGFLVSEASFQILTRNTEREVADIQIVIPHGTAQRVEKGYPVPSIPESMISFEGDRIIVENNDEVSHQLGPIWVPADSSGVLTLEKPQTFSLACTFQPTKVMGIEVRPRLTNNIRFQGILAICLPSGILIWLFSIVVLPVNIKKPEE